mgnify:CR=1 FL=1
MAAEIKAVCNHDLVNQACRERGIDYQDFIKLCIFDLENRIIAPMQLELIELREKTMDENDRREYEWQIQNLETRIANAIHELEG